MWLRAARQAKTCAIGRLRRIALPPHRFISEGLSRIGLGAGDTRLHPCWGRIMLTAMRFGNEEDDAYVEDRRGEGGGGRRVGLQMGVGGTIVVLALSVLLKRNLFHDLGTSSSYSRPSGESARSSASGQARIRDEEALKHLAVSAFNDAQKTWTSVLHGGGPGYRPARLVLFWDETRSGCGAAGAEMGPFYCPADERVYIDLGFYRDLAQRFGAPGDFAQAYVIAHEVGHHVQTVLGIEAQVRRGQRQNTRDRNRLSVLMELQADCFAGVWGHAAQGRGLLEGRRHRRRSSRRGRRWRRPPAESRDRARQPGELHPWLGGAALALVPPRPGQRPGRVLRHLRRRPRRCSSLKVAAHSEAGQGLGRASQHGAQGSCAKPRHPCAAPCPDPVQRSDIPEFAQLSTLESRAPLSRFWQRRRR